jgi:hypothetical protein
MPNSPAYEWQDRQFNNPYAITVKPIEGREIFPMNITFYGSTMYGGINYDNENPWTEPYYSSLLFYPFYTADGQRLPPAGYINGEPATLPLRMVTGYTDLGNPIR